mmetsp:Transcript_321/g.1070  ORF Transcript_321/g.1070 Transcript_321/m.1070 type:complete len:215 (-) Transcript_321:3072-3716(-)
MRRLASSNNLLHRTPTHALHKCALNLANINRGIKRPTDVHDNVGPQHLELASEAVNLNLAHSCTIGEVVEGIAPAPLAQIDDVEVRHRVKSLRREVDPVKVRPLDHLEPGGILAQLATHRLEPPDDLLARVEHSLSVHVGGCRRSSRGHVWNLVRRGLRDINTVNGHAKRLCGNLNHFYVQSLSHLNPAMSDEHRAVSIHVDKRARLVQRPKSK